MWTHTISVHWIENVGTATHYTGLERPSVRMNMGVVVCMERLMFLSLNPFQLACIICTPAMTMMQMSFKATFVVIIRLSCSPWQEGVLDQTGMCLMNVGLSVTKFKENSIIDLVQSHLTTVILHPIVSYTYGTMQRLFEIQIGSPTLLEVILLTHCWLW